MQGMKPACPAVAELLRLSRCWCELSVPAAWLTTFWCSVQPVWVHWKGNVASRSWLRVISEEHSVKTPATSWH